jgi:hypothetical protein
MVELALMLPLLLIVSIGVMDFGRAMHTYIAITNAAREGARYASHFPHNAAKIRETVKQESAAGGVILQDDDIVMIVRDSEPEPPPGAQPNDPEVAHAGDQMTVGVAFDLPMYAGNLLGMEHVTLRAATRMVVFGLDTQ